MANADLSRLEAKIDKLADAVESVKVTTAAQSVNCARVCGAQHEINKSLAAQVDELQDDLREERKRVNLLTGANALLSACGTAIAALLGK